MHKKFDLTYVVYIEKYDIEYRKDFKIVFVDLQKE